MHVARESEKVAAKRATGLEWPKSHDLFRTGQLDRREDASRLTMMVPRPGACEALHREVEAQNSRLRPGLKHLVPM